MKVQMDPGLLERLDFVRGDIPRSKFVTRAIEHYLRAISHEGKIQQQLVDAVVEDEDPLVRTEP